MSGDRRSKRVLLIHWKAEEARERCERLRTAGFRARHFVPEGPPSLRELRADPPDAFVIDLARLPSQGRAVATALRQQKATRFTPIVFVGGNPEKIDRIRETLPDAVYTVWSGIGGALRRAMRNPPAEPVVPSTMDAYSGVPLPKKLGFRAGSVVLLIGAPPDFERKLEPLPQGVSVRRDARTARTILLFVKSHAELERRLSPAAEALDETGGVWIVWPKKGSGVAGDLTQQAVRKFGIDSGFVDYKICAIDDTWSGLLFSRRSRISAPS